MALDELGIDIVLRAEVERAENNINRLTGTVVASSGKMDRATQRAASQFNRLEKSLDPAARAAKTLETRYDVLNRALEKNIITQQRYTQLLAQANAAHEQTITRLNRGAAASRNMGFAVQNAGYQVGDFAVQVASGGGVLRPFIQQGTQMISMFGPWGAVLGAAGAVAGALAVSLWDTSDATKEAEEAAEEAAKKMEDFEESLADARKELRGMATDAERAKIRILEMQAANAAPAFGGGSGALNRATTADEAIEQQRRLIESQSRGLQANLDLWAQYLRLAGEIPPEERKIAEARGEVVDEINKEIEANQKLAAALGVSEKEYEIVKQQLEILADESFEGTTEQARKLAEQLVRSNGTITAIRDSAKEAEKAQKAHDKLMRSLEEERETNEELIDALRVSEREYELTAKTLDILGDGFKGTREEARALAEELLNQEEVLADIQGEYDALEKAAKEAAKEQKRIWDNAAENIQDALADAIFEGKDLFESLKDVAKRVASEIAAAMIFRPLISPIIGSVQGSLGLGGAGGLSVPGFGGGMIGVQSTAVGGGGFGLGDIASIGSNLFSGGLFSSTLAGLGRSFATSGIGQALGLSQALPRGGSIGLTGAGGAFARAAGNLPYAGIGGLAGSLMGLGSGNMLIDTGLSTLGGLGGSALGAEIAALGSFGGPIGAIVGGLAGTALGGLFKGKPSEGQTLEFSLGAGGGINAVGVDNDGSMQSANRLAQGFEQVIQSILGVTGGQIAGGAYVSQSARSGLRLNLNGSWLHFGSEAELINWLIDNRLTGGDPALTRAARLSNASSVEGLMGDLQMAQQIQNIITAANDNLSPLEQAIENVNEQFSELISNASRLGFSTSELIRLRNEEIDALRRQDALQKQLTELNIEGQVLQTLGQAGAQITSFITGYQLSGSSSLNPTQRLSLAEQEFETLLSAVEGGNLGAIGALNQSASTFLGFAREQFASSSGFTDVETRVFEALRGVRSDILSEQNINDTIQSELELTRLSQEEVGQRMVDAIREEIGALRQEITQMRIRSEAA